MGRYSHLPLEELLYRQLTPTSWDEGKTNPLKTNVFRRRNHEQGVSLYRAHLQSPRGVLQACINAQKEKLDTKDPEKVASAESFFEQYGTTVESLVEAGWRVAVIPASSFAERQLRLSEPNTIGHINALGSIDEFARHTNDLSKAAELLSAEMCLEE